MLFNSNIVTPADLKEAAKRARAAQIEKERRPRIFDVKQRLLGQDFATLEKQIAEKKEAKVREKLEDEAYMALQAQEAKRIREMDTVVEEEKKRFHAELLEYRRLHQAKESRKEFDLNDPESKRKDKPCRLGDDDPRLTISSMQRFEGEEQGENERKKIQGEQFRAWLTQQIREKKAAERARIDADLVLYQTAVANDNRVKQLEEMEEKCKRQMDKAVREYNYITYKEREKQKELEAKREIEDVRMHVNNMIHSDFLAGNSAGTPSQLAVGKVVKSTYRGMSESEKQQIKEIQLKQIEEHKEMKRAEEQRDADWMNLSSVQAAVYVETKGKLKEEARRQEQELREENRILGEKHKAHKRYLDEFVYRAPGAESHFYEQFNKTTR